MKIEVKVLKKILAVAKKIKSEYVYLATNKIYTKNNHFLSYCEYIQQELRQSYKVKISNQLQKIKGKYITFDFENKEIITEQNIKINIEIETTEQEKQEQEQELYLDNFTITRVKGFWNAKAEGREYLDYIAIMQDYGYYITNSRIMKYQKSSCQYKTELLIPCVIAELIELETFNIYTSNSFIFLKNEKKEIKIKKEKIVFPDCKSIIPQTETSNKLQKSELLDFLSMLDKNETITIDYSKQEIRTKSNLSIHISCEVQSIEYNLNKSLLETILKDISDCVIKIEYLKTMSPLKINDNYLIMPTRSQD